MTSILFKRFFFLSRLHYCFLLWRVYYPALKRFKIYDSADVDSNDDECEMDYLPEALAAKLVGSSLVKQKLYKNTTGVYNATKLKALAYAKFRIFPLICPFIPQGCSLKKKVLAYRFRLVLFDVKLYILRSRSESDDSIPPLY